MTLLIKICGLSTPEALDVALDAGADLVGFVFFAPSPRHLGFEAARALGRQVKGRAQKVALSVDADDAWLAAGVEALEPGEEPQQRRLAAARRPEQHETLAGIDLEIDRIRSDVRAEALRDPLEPDPHREPQYTPAI